MKYLELDQLVAGQRYVCVLYDSPAEIVLVYKGRGTFEDEEFIYTVEGDVRYVLHPA